MNEIQQQSLLGLVIVCLLLILGRPVLAQTTGRPDVRINYDCHFLRTAAGSSASDTAAVSGTITPIFVKGIPEFSAVTFTELKQGPGKSSRELILDLGGRYLMGSSQIKICRAAVILYDGSVPFMSFSVGQNNSPAQYCRSLSVDINQTFNLGPMQTASANETISVSCNVTIAREKKVH